MSLVLPNTPSHDRAWVQQQFIKNVWNDGTYTLPLFVSLSSNPRPHREQVTSMVWDELCKSMVKAEKELWPCWSLTHTWLSKKDFNDIDGLGTRKEPNSQKGNTSMFEPHRSVLAFIDQNLGHTVVTGRHWPADALFHTNILTIWKPGSWATLKRIANDISKSGKHLQLMIPSSWSVEGVRHICVKIRSTKSPQAN